MKKQNHLDNFFSEINYINSCIDKKKINNVILELKKLKKKGGRIFLLGIGGSAANCSHLVNDFRKLCNIETYSPCDNFSEMSARINDDGWDNIFKEWLKVSKLSKRDAIFIMSVGGGDEKKKVSVNLVNAMKYAKHIGSKIFGIVGRKEGFAFKNSKLVILIPNKNKKFLTPLTEAYHSIIWHLFVSSPDLQDNKTKW